MEGSKISNYYFSVSDIPGEYLPKDKLTKFNTIHISPVPKIIYIIVSKEGNTLSKQNPNKPFLNELLSKKIDINTPIKYQETFEKLLVEFANKCNYYNGKIDFYYSEKGKIEEIIKNYLKEKINEKMIEGGEIHIYGVDKQGVVRKAPLSVSENIGFLAVIEQSTEIKKLCENDFSLYIVFNKKR